MDYKEKYEIALEHAKSLYNSMFVNNDILEQIFPELKENEDEKIRKEIISFIKEGKPYYCPNSVRRQEWANWLEKQGKPIQDETKEEDIKEQLISYFRAESRDVPHRKEIHDKWISWIEKQGEQKPIKASYTTVVETGNGGINTVVKRELSTGECYGEQKPTDKIEPKFKVGDYIKLYNFIAKVISVNSDFCEIESIETHKRFKCSNAQYAFHLWTIQDAKDGDVLSDNGEPFIFKGLDPRHLNSPVAYCGIDHENCFIVGSGAYDETNWWCSCENVQPATKKQCELLFTKMKEAGYEWDNDKKKLNQIKQCKH